MKWLTYRNDNAKQRLREAAVHARDLGLKKSLTSCFQTIRNICRNYGGECELLTDFAPLSFSWAIYKGDRCMLTGGMIFHGPHDGFGSGSAPTFSVSLSPEHGWQLHT